MQDMRRLSGCIGRDRRRVVVGNREAARRKGGGDGHAIERRHDARDATLLHNVNELRNGGLGPNGVRPQGINRNALCKGSTSSNKQAKPRSRKQE